MMILQPILRASAFIAAVRSISRVACFFLFAALALGTRQPSEKCISNSQAWTFYKVTGRVQENVTFRDLIAELDSRLYRERIVDPEHLDFPLADEDVITIGEEHSGFVCQAPYVCHFRGASRHVWLKRAKKFRALKEPVSVSVDELDLYPRNIKERLLETAGDEAAERVLSEMETRGVLGFFRDRDTLQEALKRIPKSRKLKVLVWRKPAGLRIVHRIGPGSDDVSGSLSRKDGKAGPDGRILTLFADEYVSFGVEYVYSHIKDGVVSRLPEDLAWEPEELFNSAGFVEGRSVGKKGATVVVRHRKFPYLTASVFLELEPKPGICGLWEWFNGGTVAFEGSQESGRMTQTGFDGSPVNQGTWQRMNPYERLYELRWDSGGWVDVLKLSRDGKSLKGTNNRRFPVTGVRIEN
ncbi:MAG: hypothetical protein JXB23_10835 [Candidatus Aminicenantes bacterium]|nr:hypothetical protein [Candidatus Aminicenantes bacterium]